MTKNQSNGLHSEIKEFTGGLFTRQNFLSVAEMGSQGLDFSPMLQHMDLYKKNDMQYLIVLVCYLPDIYSRVLSET